MVSVKNQGIENEEVKKRYRELVNPSSDEYDSNERKAKIDRYKMAGYESADNLLDLYFMDSEKAVKTGIYKEYMSELENQYASEIEDGRKAMESLERLRSTNIEDIYSSGGYRAAKKKIKSIERG